MTHAQYDQESWKKETPNGECTPREMLRALMRQNDVSQADIGKIIGSASAVSMFLKGDRALSKALVRALA